MAAAVDVGVSKLVDQHDLGSACNDGVEVHFLEPLAFVFNTAARDRLQTLKQRLGFASSMRLDYADDDVVAVALAGLGLLQHFVSLSDAGRGADKNSELARAAFFAAGRFEQSFRRGPMIGIAALIRHP